jgi:S1-C subfamily serine protease
MANVEALLGVDFYGRYRVTIDYEKREMTFRPNGFEPGDTFGKFVARAQGAKYEKTPPPRAVALGISVADPPAGGRGARVTAVLAGSSAEQAGFKVGDSIVGIENWWVEDAQDLYAHAPLFNPNATLKFYVLRDGKMETLNVKFRAGL